MVMDPKLAGNADRIGPDLRETELIGRLSLRGDWAYGEIGPMTAERLLRLLSLFTVRRSWGGDELAQRLGVTPRTIRRDVERLRDLGYQVRAVPGPYGGYELGAGAGVP